MNQTLKTLLIVSTSIVQPTLGMDIVIHQHQYPHPHQALHARADAQPNNPQQPAAQTLFGRINQRINRNPVYQNRYLIGTTLCKALALYSGFKVVTNLDHYIQLNQINKCFATLKKQNQLIMQSLHNQCILYGSIFTASVLADRAFAYCIRRNRRHQQQARANQDQPQARANQDQPQPGNIFPDEHFYFLHMHPRTPATIRNRYRRLAVRTHPDRGGNPEHFRLLNQEYELVNAFAERGARRHLLHEAPELFAMLPTPRDWRIALENNAVSDQIKEAVLQTVLLVNPRMLGTAEDILQSSGNNVRLTSVLIAGMASCLLNHNRRIQGEVARNTSRLTKKVFKRMVQREKENFISLLSF